MYRRSSTYEEDERNLSKKINTNTTRRKISDLLCGMMDYSYLISSVSYNLFWLYYFNSLSENVNVVHHSSHSNCIDATNWIQYIRTWSAFCLVKSFLMITLTKICCSNENDITMLCLLIKIMTSFIPSLILILAIPDEITHYISNGRNIVIVENKEREQCNDLITALNLYEKVESWYILMILSMFCFIPLGAICMALKEMWKSRKYINKEKLI